MLSYSRLEGKTVVFSSVGTEFHFSATLQKAEEHGAWLESESFIRWTTVDLDMAQIQNPVTFIPLTNLLYLLPKTRNSRTRGVAN
ncbi:MAG: hypothetical protein NVS1B11_10190 [Terriglobales bacterium]